MAGRIRSSWGLAVLAGLVIAAAGCGAGKTHTAAPPARATASSHAGTAPAKPGAGGLASPAVVPTPIKIDGNTVQYHGQRSVIGKSSATVQMHDIYFSPSVLVGSPGQKLAVTVVNDGAISHTFTIASEHIDLVLAAGKRGTAMVTFPRSGRTPWICRYHIAAGMAGLLVAH